MSHAPPIRILVADDHPVVRRGFESLIGAADDMCLVGEAATGAEVVALYRRHRPDVTLMDLRMPDLPGAEAITAIRAEDPQARIVVVTVRKVHETAYQALRAGARGYLVKDASSDEILATIRCVHQGQRRIPADIAEAVLVRLGQEDLTPREVEILKLAARGQSNKQIADALSIRPGTAKNHIAHILVKMGAQDRTHAVTLALERHILEIEDLAEGRARY